MHTLELNMSIDGNTVDAAAADTDAVAVAIADKEEKPSTPNVDFCVAMFLVACDCEHDSNCISSVHKF